MKLKSAVVALLATLPVVGIVGTAGPAAAADSATVGVRTANSAGGDDRGHYEYSIFPGGVQLDWISVANYRYHPITVRLFAKDATTADGVAYQVQSSEAEPVDLGSWIALKKTTLTIPPRTEKVVPFQLSVPKNATPGDHAGAVVVSLLAKAANPKGGEIVVDHRVGLRMLLRVPGVFDPRLAVEHLTTSWEGQRDALGRGTATVTYTVHNVGNVIMAAGQGVRLTRMPGLPSIEAKPAPLESILPGGTVQVTQTFRHVFGTGPMQAHVALQPRPGDPSLADEVDDVAAASSFVAIPWLLIAELLLLIGLFVGGRWYQQHRRARRLAGDDSDGVEASLGEPRKVLVRGLVIGGVLLALLGLSTPARAADSSPAWKARTTLTSGTAGQPFDIVTSGGCPAPATNIVAMAYGVGFPKAGAVVIGNGDAGVDQAGPFDAPLADNLASLMAEQPHPKAFRGTYRIELRCIKAMDPYHPVGRYVTSIAFDSPYRWHAVGPPAGARQGPRTHVQTNGEPAQPHSGAAHDSGAHGGAPKSSQDAGSGSQPGDSTNASGAADQRAGELTATTSGSSFTWPLLMIGVAVLAAVAFYLSRTRPSPASPTTPKDER